jgi:hypothetical protein
MVGKIPYIHVPTASTAQQPQSYFTVPVPPQHAKQQSFQPSTAPVPSQSCQVTFANNHSQEVTYHQHHYYSNSTFCSAAAFMAQQQSPPPPAFNYEGICQAFISNMQNGAPEKATLSLLEEMYNMCHDNRSDT